MLVDVAVAVAVDVAVGVDTESVNDKLQVLISCAAGLLDGTFGATAVLLV